LTGTETLLAQTVRRIGGLCRRDHILVATGRHLAEATLQALPGFTADQLLIEPVARNTAACLAWAAATVARRDPDAVVMALPADQHISDEEGFRAVLERATLSAASGVVTTVGIRPTHAETGYGYIEADPAARGEVEPVLRFVEKPDKARAEAFLAAGNFYWNAGMFFFRAGDMMRAVETHLPGLASCIAKLDDAAAEGRESQVLDAVFEAMPSVSIDHGVMEHMSTLAVVPGDFGWSDVGSWLSASELGAHDENGNSAPPHALFIDAKGNHVVDLRGDDTRRAIAIVGCDDLVVVETDDALLIVPRDRAQDVRRVVAALVARGDEALT
jgi:mannose-1-phosphate guanylyltransferase